METGEHGNGRPSAVTTAARVPAPKASRHSFVPPWLVILALTATLFALVPLFYLVVRAAEYPTDAFLGTVFSERSGRLAGTSLALAAAVTGICVVVGVGLAFLVTRSNIPGRRLLAVAAALPLAVPSYVAAFGWQSMSLLVNPGTAFDGFLAATVVMSSVTYPYVYLPAVAALRSIDPSQEEAARSLGSGPVATFFRVTARQATPAIASGALLCAIYVIADFGAPSILRVDTFTRAIFTSFSMGFDYIGAIALSSVLLVLTVTVLIAEGRVRRTGTRYARLVNGGGGRPLRLDLGPWRIPAAGLGWLCALISLGVPMAALAVWSYRGVSTPGTLTAVATALGNSLWASGAAAVVTTLVALPLALLLARRPTFLARSLERLAYLAHSLPGVVVGLSVVMMGIAVLPGLYQTMWLLVLAYCTLLLPLALGPAVAAALNAPPELEDVSRSLGKTPVISYLRVTLPVMAPGIVSGFLMVLLTAIKELPATLMLRPTGFDTLATRLWTHTSNQSYAAAAPFALLLVLLAAIPAWMMISRLLKEP